MKFILFFQVDQKSPLTKREQYLKKLNERNEFSTRNNIFGGYYSTPKPFDNRKINIINGYQNNSIGQQNYPKDQYQNLHFQNQFQNYISPGAAYQNFDKYSSINNGNYSKIIY